MYTHVFAHVDKHVHTQAAELRKTLAKRGLYPEGTKDEQLGLLLKFLESNAPRYTVYHTGRTMQYAGHTIYRAHDVLIKVFKSTVAVVH